jgi:Family of unknown function (DUF6069)
MSGKQQIGSRSRAVAAAVAATLAVWVVAELVLGFELRGPVQGGSGATHDANVAVVAVAALVASLAGWASLAALERFTTRACGLWTAAALAVTKLSIAGPLSGAGIIAANQAWLALMHLSVAAVLVPLLRRTTPRHTPLAEDTSPASDTTTTTVVVGGEPR